MRYIRTCCAAAALLWSLAGCESKTAPAAEATGSTGAPAADSTAAPGVATAAYVCPMECEGSASNAPGKCPVCTMDLEPNPAASAPASTL